MPLMLYKQNITIMKNKLYLCAALLVACTFSFQMNAQLSVSSSGNVTMPRNVAIGDSLPNNTAGLRVDVSASTDRLLNYGIYSSNAYERLFYQNDGCHIGVVGRINRDIIFPGPKGGSRPVPMPFDAGVAGLSSSGCGIYGSTNTTLPYTWNAGIYAGYFDGDVNVTGDLTATNLRSVSDIRFKDNITYIQESVFDRINGLHPITFTFKTDSMLYMKDGEDMRIHYGMIAQEVKTVFPEIVSETQAGYLSVNYIELIPILIQAVKQQQTQIEELQSKLYELTNNTKRNLPARQTDRPQLKQNTPNPFSQNTKIDYYLPTDTREAAIRVHDMSGAEIAVYPIVSFGQGELTINGGTFRAGMYLYSLIADGQLVDTKQMILTK